MAIGQATQAQATPRRRLTGLMPLPVRLLALPAAIEREVARRAALELGDARLEVGACGVVAAHAYRARLRLGTAVCPRPHVGRHPGVLDEPQVVVCGFEAIDHPWSLDEVSYVRTRGSGSR